MFPHEKCQSEPSADRFWRQEQKPQKQSDHELQAILKQIKQLVVKSDPFTQKLNQVIENKFPVEKGMFVQTSCEKTLQSSENLQWDSEFDR